MNIGKCCFSYTSVSFAKISTKSFLGTDSRERLSPILFRLYEKRHVCLQFLFRRTDERSRGQERFVDRKVQPGYETSLHFFAEILSDKESSSSS